ncbi:hypothetical protein [Puerhibacterium sp. TATVAM-FAB25]|uniref:hypothetical protein n=1 Tax=Puerhibacterium sp. TATVAM-FAB25 TaxID=3093699 RepID=UPI003979046E
MSDATPLPNAKEVRDLVEGLLGRDVEVQTGGAMVDPAGALVGTYVDRTRALQAVVLLDLPLAAHVGAAIGLVPAHASAEAAADGVLPPTLAENAAEVLNVIASLFNADGAPHLKLDTVHAPGAPLPADVASWALAYVRRTDLDVEVSGYGRGSFSLLVL